MPRLRTPWTGAFAVRTAWVVAAAALALPMPVRMQRSSGLLSLGAMALCSAGAAAAMIQIPGERMRGIGRQGIGGRMLGVRDEWIAG